LNASTDPNSAVPDIQQILNLQHRLADSQWLSAGELLERQLAEAGALLAHAYRSVPWYRECIERAGIDPQAPLSLAQWQRLPSVSRVQIQELGTTLRSNDIPPSHGEVVTNSSSGSTGRSVSVLGTVHDAVLFKAIELRFHLWHERDFDKPLAAIRKFPRGEAEYPDGQHSDRWGDLTTFPFPTGPSYALNTSASTGEQLEWLQRHRPYYLMTFPSNLQALCLHCREKGVTLPGLGEVITVGEVVTPELRALCHEVFGEAITDGYSAMEVGRIALQCPEHTHYHVQSERLLVEVVDAQGKPCSPGEIGQVLLTPLHNYAMPLPRYAIGDYAEVGEACDCGRGLPVLKRILGRQRNTLITPDGQRYRPSFGTRGFQRLAPIRQHQFIQHDLTHIEGRFVVERPVTAEEEQALLAHIRGSLPCDFEIRATYHHDLPRSPSGKIAIDHGGRVRPGAGDAEQDARQGSAGMHHRVQGHQEDRSLEHLRAEHERDHHGDRQLATEAGHRAEQHADGNRQQDRAQQLGRPEQLGQAGEELTIHGWLGFAFLLRRELADQRQGLRRLRQCRRDPLLHVVTDQRRQRQLQPLGLRLQFGIGKRLRIGLVQHLQPFGRQPASTCARVP
jgi:phenylacetate-CoA ligase